MWERAGREEEFEHAVKGENCSCVIPGQVGVDGNQSLGGGMFSAGALSWFLSFPMDLLIFLVLSFSQ